jgi:hypothetical protein
MTVERCILVGAIPLSVDINKHPNFQFNTIHT